MKFTSKDLMEAMGLKVGDRVEADMGTMKATFEVRKDFTLLRLDHIPIHNARTGYDLWDILGLNYKIIPAPKRIGDLKCSSEIKCENCPLRAICETIIFNLPIKLYDILKRYELNNSTELDQEIYNLLMARLDRVVFERHDNMEVKESGK